MRSVLEELGAFERLAAELSRQPLPASFDAESEPPELGRLAVHLLIAIR